MKRIFLFAGLLAVMMVSFTSCSSVKKDCQGNRHYKLKNGIYL